MAEERIVTTDAPSTHTTVVHDGESRSSGGSGWVIAIVLLLAVLAGIYFFTQMSGSEVAKDNAVTNAANAVGGAAKDVGNAANDAVDK